MGFIVGQQQERVASCVVAVEEAGTQLFKTFKFWK